MKIIALLLGVLVLSSCKKDAVEGDLEQFVTENQSLSEDYLIACAAGNLSSFMGSTEQPISIFYYNVDGASTAILYVKSIEGDHADYSNYSRANETPISMFNGRMGRFPVSTDYNGRWVVVAYTSGTSYHISDPILIHAESLPTADITSQIVVQGDSLQPEFDWSADVVPGNVIYFSLISNGTDDFISGVYTTEKNWNFYDLSNVVLNVTPTSSPTLNAQESYMYTNMGVDEDNWVRTFGSIPF
jgi:hypothetical protein